jgi:hypothetical protein
MSLARIPLGFFCLLDCSRSGRTTHRVNGIQYCIVQYFIVALCSLWSERSLVTRAILPHCFEDDAERCVAGQRKLNAELQRSKATNARLC